jgi:anti-sigma factor RsiW
VIDEADRLIAEALRDHARVPAPARLRRALARRASRAPRCALGPIVSALAGAAAAAAFVLVVARPPAARLDVVDEAVGDHQRVLAARSLGVEASDMHHVKPWFAGKLDFVPPVGFVGDDEFPLRGGDVAVFLGHKAATFVFARKLHVISLFVFEADDVPAREATVRGFHVATWSDDGFGFALVSDVNWDDVRRLRDRLAP